MIDRLKVALPLSLAVGLLTFTWLEISLNFTFHWVTNGDLGNGLALPGNVQLVAPAGFVSWAVYFAAGPERPALKALVASFLGAGAALLLMWVAPLVADLPDFWGIAVVTTVIATLAVAATSTGELYFAPGVFAGFATVVFWWIATGLDGWAPGGGGGENNLAALATPEKAGFGAFGGVLSTPVEWVFVSCALSLGCGVVLGATSVWLAGVLTPRTSVSQPAATATAV